MDVFLFLVVFFINLHFIFLPLLLFSLLLPSFFYLLLCIT